MTAALRLSPDLILPADFATEGVAVIGMRGSGKSNTEVHFAEVEFDAGIPWVAVDPKGDWWGIRSSADGSSPGLPVPIFGGLHGVVQLEPNMGSRIADLLVDENLTAILDVSHLSKTGGLPQFLTAFCNQLMHRHQLDPHVRTVILEEAHRYIPQSVPREKAAMKEAAASLLLEGRSFGLGCWAASQRPARLNKDVLEEVGNALVFRIGVAATNDKKAVKAWTEHYDLGPEIVASLTELHDGEAWALMPQDRIVRRVQMDRRATFDSGGTPKVGAASRRPSTLADIDPAAIKEALSDVIERAKADDPKELRARIRALEKQLAERPSEKVVETVTETVEVEVPVLDQQLVTQLEQVLAGISTEAAGMASAADGIAVRLKEAAVRPVRRSEQDAKRERKTSTPPTSATRPGETTRAAPATRPAPTGAVEAISDPQQRILDSLAWFMSVGIAPVDRGQLALRSGVSPGSGSYGQNLGALRAAGLIDYPGKGLVGLTAAGADVAEAADEIYTSEQLHDALCSRLPDPQAKILRALIAVYPDDIGRSELAERCGVSPGSGSYGQNLGALRSLRLIDYPAKGRVVALPVLFLETRP